MDTGPHSALSRCARSASSVHRRAARNVRRNLVQLPRTLARASDALPPDAKEHIGTIHTMQGKESDVVILVLGTHPRRNQKAREWTSETSSLLNVAVSRAKRRLLVIGNHAEGSKTATSTNWPPSCPVIRGLPTRGHDSSSAPRRGLPLPRRQLHRHGRRHERRTERPVCRERPR
ncbi:MAG: AAA domain-containing protein [Actinoallomurus sp.]